jgi:hypothetical protein
LVRKITLTDQFRKSFPEPHAGVRIAGRNGPRNRKALPKIQRKLPKTGRC